MLDLDTTLRETFARAAEPGDPTGVADVIRSRVAAGDTGTTSADGAGFDGGSGWSWLPWVGGAVVVAVAGAAIGASGLLWPMQSAESASSLGFGVAQFTAGLDCPAGTRVVSFLPGDRVYAVARSDDSSYLAVRSPYDRSDTVWVTTSDLELDPDQPAVASLDVGGCPIPVISVKPTPTPTPEPEPEPDPEPEPGQPEPPNPPDPPAPDTTKPTLGTPSGGSQVACTAGYPQPETTTVSVPTSDNKGVAGVSISWSGVDSGSAQMSKSGSAWTYTYNPPDLSIGNVTFTMVARDAAGNHSSPKNFGVTIHCLI